MKKTLIVLLTAVLSISMLFVSCSNEAKFDETVQIGFSSASVRGLIASQDIPGANNLYWFYKAAKTPGKEGVNINYGAQSKWTPVKVDAKGLTPEGSNGLITLAQGRWDFELQGRKFAADESTAVYQGSTSNVLIVKNGETVNSITVPVSQLATGTGTVLLSKDITVKSNDSSISGYKPTSYKYSLSGKNEWTTVSNADFSNDITLSLPAATYDFVVMYDRVDDRNTIIYASAPITITVSANITTKMRGSLEVEKTTGQFGVEVVGSTATAPVTPSATESKTVVVPISPSKEQGTKTTVTLPENSISGETSNVKLTVKTLTSNEVYNDNQFTVSEGKAALAGISLTLVGTNNGTETEINSFNNNYVTIETIIEKNLSNVVVRYNGTGYQPVCNNDSGNPSNVADDLDSNDSYVYGYSSKTGRLVFKTNHFSDYYIEADPVCEIGDVKYASIHDAVDNASDCATIKLLENISMNLSSEDSCISIDNKKITIDGSNKTITLTANTAESKTYGIFITGSDSSKIVTIKNATINTTNLERAIRTEGNIGVVIKECTITTNGCGIHVKGENEVEINNTAITVTVIDNATYAAHLRTAVMVGGEEANVTVNGCTINAVNEDKTNDKNTMCKGLYVGSLSKNAIITANNTSVSADYSIAIDGAQNDHTSFEGKPTQIVINSGEYSGLFGSPSGLSYKSLTINGGIFSGITDLNSFNGKDDDIAKLVISGGTFDINPSDYVPSGYIATKVGDNYFVHKENEAVVTTAAELKAILTEFTHAGSGNSTVTIASDIQLAEGETWTPASIDGYNGAGVITIKGENHTIKGLKAPLLAGGFAGNSGIVINDLTLEDSNIDDTYADQGLGGFICSIDSMPRIELNNCHLKKSSIISTNGARVGGLIGWTAGYNNPNDGPVRTYVTVTNCSVEDTIITAKGSVGGIIGHAGNNPATYHTITGCSVTGTTLNSTDDGDWRVGVVVGTANVGEVTISGITESGNTLTQTGKTAPEHSNLYGRFVPDNTGKLTIGGVDITK